MDRLIIERKLESLRRSLERVSSKCPRTVEELIHDIDAQDVVVLNLSRAVQQCVDIGTHLLSDSRFPTPETMGSTFELLAAEGIIDPDLAARIKKSVGFRNVAVHSYSVLDMAIVHAIARDHLEDFRSFGRAVAEVLKEQ